MKRILNHISGDRPVWAIATLLAIFSFLPVYSSSSNRAYLYGNGNTIGYIFKHLIHLFLGFSIMYGAHKIPYNYYKGISLLMIPVIIVLLAYTIFQPEMSDSMTNSSSWIKIPVLGFTFQPSTLASSILLIYIARYLAKIKDDVVTFSKAEVYDSRLESNSFDFAVSNGVFHHLKHSKIEKAIEEVSRVLKPNGWFWYYIDGEGAIAMELWDASVEILKEVPTLQIETILKVMNLSRNKMVFVMDGLSAVYIHSSLEETTSMLQKYGFSNFKRLTGGEPTDFDLDVVESDPYGKEKFGCGDLRILCQLVN